MKTVTFNSNFGQFKNRLTGQFPDELADTIAQCALADILYRVCGSSADKKLGVVGKKPKEGVTGYADRKSVSYSEANCAIIAKAVDDKIDELCGKGVEKPTADHDAYNVLGLQFSITGQHVFGEVVSAMVMATTLVDAMGKDEAVESAYLTVFDAMGYTGGNDRAKLIEFAHSKGLGIRPATK